MNSNQCGTCHPELMKVAVKQHTRRKPKAPRWNVEGEIRHALQFELRATAKKFNVTEGDLLDFIERMEKIPGHVRAGIAFSKGLEALLPKSS
jgi:hypothetical protein